jgi:hypothetical protein
VIRTHLEKQGIKLITAEKWGATLLKINWKYILEVWALRNEQNNGITMRDQIDRNKQKPINQLESIIPRNRDLPQSLMDLIESGNRNYSELSIPNLQAQLCGATILERVNVQRRGRVSVGRKGRMEEMKDGEVNVNEIDPG